MGYWRADFVENEVFWSEEVYNILEIKEDSISHYESFFRTIHSDDKEMFEIERLAVLAGEKTMDIEFRIIQDNGNQKWIHAFGKLEKNEKGEAIAIEGTIQDINNSK